MFVAASLLVAASIVTVVALARANLRRRRSRRELAAIKRELAQNTQAMKAAVGAQLLPVMMDLIEELGPVVEGLAEDPREETRGPEAR
jgi:hypothetical protein